MKHGFVTSLLRNEYAVSTLHCSGPPKAAAISLLNGFSCQAGSRPERQILYA